MSAWQVKNRWDSSYATRFRDSVPGGVQRHIGSSATFTCEDLAVQLIIDFAASHRLPLRIKNGSTLTGYSPGDFDSLDEYRRQVLKSTGARDLLLDANTVAVGSGTAGRESDLAFAQAGDMIVMDSGSFKHVQVVTHDRPNAVDIAQGNFRDADFRCSGDQNDPADKCYLGKTIERFGYALRDGQWRYTKPGKETVFQKNNARIRRWNFMRWNPPVPTGMPKAVVAPGRPWW